MRYWKLVGHDVVQCDLMEWATFFGTNERFIKRTDHLDDVHVSTVFIGMDYPGQPRMFESMVFGGVLDGVRVFCDTYKQAEIQHVVLSKRVWRSQRELRRAKKEVPSSGQ